MPRSVITNDSKLSYRPFDQQERVLFCYKCCGPGHEVADCKAKHPRCGHCAAKDHRTDDTRRKCGNRPTKCPNCERLGHNAFSKICQHPGTLRERVLSSKVRHRGARWESQFPVAAAPMYASFPGPTIIPKSLSLQISSHPSDRLQRSDAGKTVQWHPSFPPDTSDNVLPPVFAAEESNHVTCTPRQMATESFTVPQISTSSGGPPKDVSPRGRNTACHDLEGRQSKAKSPDGINFNGITPGAKKARPQPKEVGGSNKTLSEDTVQETASYQRGPFEEAPLKMDTSRINVSKVNAQKSKLREVEVTTAKAKGEDFMKAKLISAEDIRAVSRELKARRAEDTRVEVETKRANVEAMKRGLPKPGVQKVNHSKDGISRVGVRRRNVLKVGLLKANDLKVNAEKMKAKNAETETVDPESMGPSQALNAIEVKRRPGRPRIHGDPKKTNPNNDGAKRGRGRPRIHDNPKNTNTNNDGVKRGRGRPRKSQTDIAKNTELRGRESKSPTGNTDTRGLALSRNTSLHEEGLATGFGLSTDMSASTSSSPIIQMEHERRGFPTPLSTPPHKQIEKSTATDFNFNFNFNTDINTFTSAAETQMEQERGRSFTTPPTPSQIPASQKFEGAVKPRRRALSSQDSLQTVFHTLSDPVVREGTATYDTLASDDRVLPWTSWTADIQTPQKSSDSKIVQKRTKSLPNLPSLQVPRGGGRRTASLSSCLQQETWLETDQKHCKSPRTCREQSLERLLASTPPLQQKILEATCKPASKQPIPSSISSPSRAKRSQTTSSSPQTPQSRRYQERSPFEDSRSQHKTSVIDSASSSRLSTAKFTGVSPNKAKTGDKCKDCSTTGSASPSRQAKSTKSVGTSSPPKTLTIKGDRAANLPVPMVAVPWRVAKSDITDSKVVGPKVFDSEVAGSKAVVFDDRAEPESTEAEVLGFHAANSPSEARTGDKRKCPFEEPLVLLPRRADHHSRSDSRSSLRKTSSPRRHL